MGGPSDMQNTSIPKPPEQSGISNSNSTIDKSNVEKKPNDSDVNASKEKKKSGDVRVGFGSDADEIEDSNQDLDDNKSNSGKDNKDKKDDLNKKLAIAAIAAQAATMVMQLIFLLKLMMWLRMMLQMLAAVAVNLFKAFLAGVAAVAKAAVAVVMSVVSTVATALGVSVVVSATGIGGVAVLVVVVAISAVASYSASQTAVRDYLPPDDCESQVRKVVAGAPLDIDTDGITFENAQKLHSVLTEYGMSDINIAGMIGNFSAESGIDHTKVETIYDEPFTYGPRKQAAEAVDFKINIFNPTVKLGGVLYTIAAPNLKDQPCGIGLGQWSLGRNIALRNFAEANGTTWYDFDIQIAFMLAGDGGDSAWIANWASASTPEEAADQFRTHWERVSLAVEERKQAAATWFVEIQEWDVDYAYAGYVMDVVRLANDTVVDASNSSIRSAKDRCSEGKKIGKFLASYGEFGPPVDPDQMVLGSPFGSRTDPINGTTSHHTGLDIRGPMANGKPIYAVKDGVVTVAGVPGNGTYGYTVIVAHEGDTASWYNHCLSGSLLVNVGDKVKKGQQIASIGSTGRSTGPHLHFEFRVNTDGSYMDGTPVDPISAGVITFS